MQLDWCNTSSAPRLVQYHLCTLIDSIPVQHLDWCNTISVPGLVQNQTYTFCTTICVQYQPYTYISAILVLHFSNLSRTAFQVLPGFKRMCHKKSYVSVMVLMNTFQKVSFKKYFLGSERINHKTHILGLIFTQPTLSPLFLYFQSVWVPILTF